MVHKKISLIVAVLININIVVGGAFFLSARTMRMTTATPFLWLFVGLMLLPLVHVLSYLTTAHYQDGGLHAYSHNALSPSWGFLSGWGYYIGTAAGNALILHAFTEILTQFGLAPAQRLWFDIGFTVVFALLNFYHVEFLGAVQKLFTALKAIPFIVVLIGAFFLFSPHNFSLAQEGTLPDFVSNIPFALFAYIGIEACCAISHIIKDGKKNASRAIVISFGIIVALYSITQFLLLGIHGVHTPTPFTTILQQLTTNHALVDGGNKIIMLAILSSYLGGFYSMFYANNWNLHSLAQKRKLPFSSDLLRLNTYESPWVCIMVQALIIIALLALTQHDTTTLVTMSDFGIVIAYTLSVVSYLVLNKKHKQWGYWALFSCMYFLYLCSRSLFDSGTQYALPFLGLLIFGFVLYRLSGNSN